MLGQASQTDVQALAKESGTAADVEATDESSGAAQTLKWHTINNAADDDATETRRQAIPEQVFFFDFDFTLVFHERV